MILTAVIHREGDVYVAQCLNVNVSSFGPNTEAARANLCEALELYFEDGTSTPVLDIADASVHEIQLTRD